MRKIFFFMLIVLLVYRFSYGFDNIKNGWYINLDIGIEDTNIEERIYDENKKKTISESSDRTSAIVDLGFGYIFKNNFIIGAGYYYSSLGKNPKLITNKENNNYFDIYETGNYLSIGSNFKTKHYIRFFLLSSFISGNGTFIKDSDFFEGGGYKLQYSYELVNHLLFSVYFRFISFVNENEWSNKIDIGSIGVKIGWLFY